MRCAIAEYLHGHKKKMFFFSFCFNVFFFFPNKFQNIVIKRLLCRDYRETVHTQAGPYNYRAQFFIPLCQLLYATSKKCNDNRNLSCGLLNFYFLMYNNNKKKNAFILTERFISPRLSVESRLQLRRQTNARDCCFSFFFFP